MAEKIITQREAEQIAADPAQVAVRLEGLLQTRRLSKHAVLACLSTYFGQPHLEYDEALLVPQKILHLLDLQRLKQELWVPLARRGAMALVVSCVPQDAALQRRIENALHVPRIRFSVALPSDIVRIIEHNQDVNPHFPPAAGRTPLAVLRTRLAEYRVRLARYRTALAEGRTGLAFIRTGVSFMTIGLVLLRVFGFGPMSVLAGLLLCSGLVMTVDGIGWDFPTRKATRVPLDFCGTEPTFGTTILMAGPGEDPAAAIRSAAIQGAGQLRLRWNRLTPVMKRRFFAGDRTDLAEERTALAGSRTMMARSRTGLAFTRTGIAFSGLGIALWRQFPGGLWVVFFGSLIVLGASMVIEGFRWYVPGRQAGQECYDAVRCAQKNPSIWDFMFRPFSRSVSPDDLPPTLVIKASHAPGIYGTTGLALERTLIADRRNVKARLRTIMARSRTGMAFIRTGASIFSVGLGLQVYFGAQNPFWTLFNIVLILAGAILVVDGFYWHLPAERIKKQFPYCFGDMEISMPDYARPAQLWKKVVFSHEDL